MTDKIIFEDSGITIETPKEPAGTSDLGNLLVKYRKAASFSSSHLSDEATCLLIEVAFYLSMRSDEGRFPNLRIVSGKQNDSRLVIKFSTPLKFSDVHELRRLSPVAESPDFALLVNEVEGGGLECPGLANIGHRGLQSMPGRPEILSPGGPPSLMIWIKGPGHLFISDTSICFEYRAGRVRLVISAIYTIPRLREFTANISKALHRKAVESVSEIPDADQFFGGQSALTGITNLVLRRILDTCLELRHGGAFVILPGEDSTYDSFGISCKFPLYGPNLGEDISDYWSTHIRTSDSKKKGVEEYDRNLRKSYQSKARLLNNVDAITHLSAADGCVVLTESLRVIGFGGSILVSEEECKSTQTKVKLSRDSSCSIDYFLSNVGGQRHQSAARLVIKYNDIIVFVISQDGELSVVACDSEGYVRIYRPVDPSDTPAVN